MILICCAALSCCREDHPTEHSIERSFAITKENETGMNSIRSLAFEARAWKIAKDQSQKQGWKGVGGKSQTIPASTSFKNHAEELNFYGNMIFRSLDYPMQENTQSKFTLTTESELLVRHSKEALAQFELLLVRWKRSRDERFNDMLNPNQ